ATLSFVQRLTVAPALTGTDAGLVGAASAALRSGAAVNGARRQVV
ncbi:ROK family protein, partial [Streptomyces sp. SID14478]|nr:ROK family protein [Streptomyces sp. SID14478]